MTFPPTVLGCHETVDAIVAGRLSVSRYGDGEYKTVLGAGTRTQPGSPELTRRMREILMSDDPRLMVCLLDVWHDHPVADVWPSREKTVARFGGRDFAEKYLKPDRVWGCAAITRLCSWALGDHAEYWAKWRSIWQDRPVLLCCGSKKGRGSAHGVLSNAARVDVWDLERKVDCFAIYPKILRECMRWADKNAADDPLVVAALGASATCLAADMCAQGVQCIDIGHMQQAYSRISPKTLDEP